MVLHTLIKDNLKKKNAKKNRKHVTGRTDTSIQKNRK